MEQYFFNKEQVEKTNGYSNDYWDWGMEDDDLFWRCYLEGYANVSELDLGKQSFVKFDGSKSKIKVEVDRQLSHLTSKSHTVSVLVRANQQEDKVPIWLVGDYDRRFCEYPILRRPTGITLFASLDLPIFQLKFGSLLIRVRKNRSKTHFLAK